MKKRLVPSARELTSALIAVLVLLGVAAVIDQGDAVAGGGPTTDTVFIATGENYPDALGAGPAAALGIGPILLVTRDGVPGPTLTELNRLQPSQIYIVGGPGVVSDEVKAVLENLSFSPTVTRLSGANRFATAAAISEALFPAVGFLGALDTAVDSDLLDGLDSSAFLGALDTAVDSDLLDGLDSSAFLGAFDTAADSELLDGLDSTELDPSLLCTPGEVFVGFDRSGAVCRNPGTTHPIDGAAGDYVSMALDSSGSPVVSYHNGALRVAHCRDPLCQETPSVEVVDDPANEVGRYTSIALDADGNPVISYEDHTAFRLKLVHCNDPDCSGGDESIVTPVTFTNGEFTSLVLDASGSPVVSFRGASHLIVLHCNDPNCAGGDDSAVNVDMDSDTGHYTSLVLDVAGNPVVSYFADHPDDKHLRVLHCNDPNCAGGDESIEVVDDSSADVGWYTSLALDASGFPVVSYFDNTNTALKLVHCNDPNCAGGDESIVTVDNTAYTGMFTSLVLDALGYPVVSYFDNDAGDLMLVHCNDPDCTGGDELITVADPSSNETGWYSSLVLDRFGDPVIAHTNNTTYDVWVTTP